MKPTSLRSALTARFQRMSTRTARTRADPDRWTRPIVRFGVLAVLLAGWQMAGTEDVQIALPTVTRTMAALFDLIADGSLIRGLLITSQALVLGFSLAMVVSIPLGILMGSSTTAERVATPYLLVLLVVPMISLTPLIQAWLGLTLTARVFLVFLATFIYITTNTMVGVRSVSPNLRQMAQSFGASRWQMLRLVVLPSATPAIMAGTRLGLSRAVDVMIVAELTLVGAGVGAMMIEFQARFEPAYLFAVIVAVLIQAVILIEAARRLEVRLLKWRGSPIS